jgi:hypothetical protein
LRVFFGFFLLAKQKKETRLSRESDQLQITMPILRPQDYFADSFSKISTCAMRHL